MATKAGVGVSSGVDSFREAANATKQALDSIQETFADACIVFASSTYDQEKVLLGVRSAAGASAVIVGCSTAGEITTGGSQSKSSVAVMVFRSNTLTFYGAVGERIHQSPYRAGVNVAKGVIESAGEVNMFIMFPDILAGNGADVVRGVVEIIGEKFPIVGGAAGDDFKFQKTFQYLQETVYTGAVTALGIKGPVRVGVGVGHGWIPIGIPRKVTKSEGSIVYEIDNKPAIEMYKEYFGDAAEELRNAPLAQLALTYPLGIKMDGYDEMLIRDALLVDEKGAITCAAEIPQGSEIQLMIGSEDEAIKMAEKAAIAAMKGLGGKDLRATLIFNCVARKKLFGLRVNEEIRAVQKAVGVDTPLLGFYTYGEQAPIMLKTGLIHHKSNPAFHNQTIVVCAIGE